MRWIPKPYQKRAVKFLLQHAVAGLFMDPGLGKTSISLETFRILKQEGMMRRALVIAPLRPARSVWAGEKGEPKKWENFQSLKVQLLHGSDKNDLLGLKGVDIDVINPEGLPWLFRSVNLNERWPWDWLIVDESSKFKRSTNKRFRLLAPHIHKFRRRTILTGTPAPRSLLDLFGQIYILDQGHALGGFYTHYRAKYFFPSGYGGYTWLPKKNAQEQIYGQLKNLVLRMDQKDHLKLPPLIINDVEVELPEDARRRYDEMENLLLTAVEDRLVSAASTAVASMKCRQIANGGIYLDGSTKHWKHLHEAKIEATVDLVEELEGKPALIAYEFRHDLERLRKAFNGAPYLGGGVSGKDQAAIEAAWNDGQLPVLLAQPQSVAHGLNLQDVGSAIIWHSLTWNLEDYIQFIRRVWRQGQKERVVVHRLIARDTVDEVMVGALKSKAKMQDALLDALRAYAMGRKR